MVTSASSRIECGRAEARGAQARKRGWALRVVVGFVSAALLLTAIVGVLHLPAAAPLLRILSPAFACPVRRGTPEQIDRAHALAALAIRSLGTSNAPARPALGFVLDETTKRDVAAWAGRYGVVCASIGGNENLQRCTGVPASAVGEPDSLGTIEEVCFEFQATGELVNVQTMRRHLAPSDAANVVGHLERHAASQIGAPSTLGGEATTSHLGRAFLSSYVAVHGFRDYRATVSATNLASTGVMVREEYVSAR